MDGNKKLRFGFAQLLIGSKSSAGNDAMHVNVIKKFLVPSVKNLYDAGRCSEIFGIGGQFQKRFGAASVKHSIKKFLIAVKQRIQFMRKRKDYMKIRGVDYFCPAFVDPDFFVDSLTVGVVAVPAGIVMDLGMSAILADAKAVSRRTGLAM